MHSQENSTGHIHLCGRMSRVEVCGSSDDFVSTLRLCFAHDDVLWPILASSLLTIDPINLSFGLR